MRTLQPGSWNHVAAKFDLFGTSVNFGLPAKFTAHFTGSGAARGPAWGKKRRHQKPPRFCPIQLEPLEQRQLLSASVTQDLFAATSGTPFNTANFGQEWIINPLNSTGNPTIVNDALSVAQNVGDPYDVDLASITNPTQNSVQQVTFNAAGDGADGPPGSNSDFGLVARANNSGLAYYGAQVEIVNQNISGGDNAELYLYYSTNNNVSIIPSSTYYFSATLGTNYDIKFEVNSNGNTSTTDLFASVWKQGSVEPNWMVTTTDSTPAFNGTGAHLTGYDGIFVNPEEGEGENSTLSNYIESNNPGDLPLISSFTASPISYTGTGSQTFVFNATAIVPGNESNSYSLNFGDGVTSTYSAIANISHTYTSAPGSADDYVYTPTLTISDSNSNNVPTISSSSQSISVYVNSAVPTPPTGAITVNRRGGNGISNSDPLIVQFTSSGSAFSSADPLTEYILNFGDGDVSSYPISTNTITSISYDLAHDYITHGTYYPTLTLVGADGATAVIDAPSILITGSASPPTVSISYNTTNSNLTATFSEDVGAALADFVNSSDTALGEPLWSDGASTANTAGSINSTNLGAPFYLPGSIAGALDVRVDNSGANLTIPSTAYSYNNSSNTATWNLSTLVNNTSTSYTARLFADDIQDAAGNDLDGMNVGTGGDDATFHFGYTGYSAPTLTLASWNSAANATLWNSSMPFVFAPSIAPDSIKSLSAVTVAGNPSTLITFVNTPATKLALEPILADINAVETEDTVDPPVIIEDITNPNFIALDGDTADINAVTATNSTDSITINVKPYGQSILSTWVANSSGSVHFSPYSGEIDGSEDDANLEAEFLTDLKKITGTAVNFGNNTTTPVNVTGNEVSNGIYVGEASQFDSSSPFYSSESFSFNDEAELGQTGYIVNSVRNDLFILGGGPSGENDAMDAFLQNLGVEKYGPQNNINGDGNNNSGYTGYVVSTGGGNYATETNIWQIMPSLSNLSGSWDIRGVPSISFVENNDFGNGNAAGVSESWNDFLDFNMGGGTPVAVVTQKGLGTWPTQNSLDNHPDWWASTGNTLNGADSVTTFGVPYGTITDGDTFTLTLTTNSSAQSITVTATSTNGDDTPSGIVSLLASAISASSQTYFSTSSIVVVSTYTADLWVNSASEWVQTPVLEIYPTANDGRSYTPTAATSGSATFQENTTGFAGADNGELNFTNPDVINFVVNSYVAGWLSENPAPNSMLTLAGSDGGNYDQSASTKALLNSQSPYTDSMGDWWGYNANGVLVAADSESYWALVNAAAASVMVYNQAHPGENLTVGGLGYEAVTQFPSFPLEPNVYVELAEGEYDHTPDSTDQVLKGFAQQGALTGVYRYWTVYTNTGSDGEPASGDASASSINTDWTMYNNDHLTGVGGESNSNYGPDGLGYYLSDVYTANATLDNSTGRATVLGNFYTNAFGPAANDMESYYVLFNGKAANANLTSPPSQQTFNGNAYSKGGQAAVTSDQEALQEAYGFVDAADTALTTAYNNGVSGSINSSQYAADQARVDQVRMYLHYLFLQYQFESDYFAYNIGGGYVNHHTAAFNAVVNDITNETLWADELAFTEGVDAQGYVDEFRGVFGAFYNIWSNDPNGSYGLATPGTGLLQNPGNNNTTIFGGATIYINNSPTQTMLNTDWSEDEVALFGPTDLVANPGSPTSVDLSWTNIAIQPGVDVGIERSTSSSFTPLTPIATVGAGVNTYVDNTVTNGTTYYYAVYAYNSTTSISSALSNTAKIATPNAAAGAIADDYWYGSNGSSWSSQWTLVNALSNGTAAATIQGDQGQVVFTKTSGAMSGGDTYLNESQTYEDSFQGVLFSMNTNTTTLLLTARTNSTAQNYYWASATTGASGNLLSIGKEVSGTSTTLASFSVGAITTNTTYDLEFEVITANTSTTDLYAKIWATTSTDPTTWTAYSTTDSTSALQGATGYDGLRFAGATGTSDTYTVGNYESANLTSSSPSYIDDFQNSSTTGWSPSKSSDWSVGTNGDSVRYYINTTSYSGSGGALGLYSVLSSTSAFSNIGDFTMTVDAAVPSYTSSSNYAIVFGYQNSTNYYFMEFSGTSGDTALYKDNSGTITQIAAASGTWITNANYNQIEIEHMGTAISVWDNGQSVLTAADSKFVNGDVGMGALNNTEAYFDNVIIGNATALSNGPSALTTPTISSTEVVLNWTDNDGGKDTGYAIERSTNGTTFSQIATVADGATAYTDTSVTYGQPYYYEIESFLWFQTSVFSNAATATPPIPAGVLAAPTDVQANAVSSNEIDLTWVDQDGGSATGYYIDLSTNGTTFVQLPSIAPAGANTYSDTSLSEGTTYYFEVQAFNTTTTSNVSTPSGPATTYLNAPTNLTTQTQSTSEIDLSWTNNSNLNPSFAIERSTTSTSGFTQINTVAAGTTTYSDTGLINGTQYYYEVDAFNSTTTSAFATANGVTFLDAPTGLTATESNGSNRTQSIALAWANNSSSTQMGIAIDRSTNGSSYSQIMTLGSSATAYTDTNIFPSTEYYYEVQSFNTVTDSAFDSVSGVNVPTNEVGSVSTDYFYGTNGSAWNSQWLAVNGMTNDTVATTIQNDAGQVVLTQKSGKTMSGTYTELMNTSTFQDSYQNVLIDSDTFGTEFGLIARTGTTASTYYLAQIKFRTGSGNYLEIGSFASNTVTAIASVSVGAISTNTLYDLEFEVVTANTSTTDLYAKVWAISGATSGTEPTTWQISTHDSTSSLQGTTKRGGMFMISTTATENTFTVDNYEAVNILSGNASYINNFEASTSTNDWTPLLTTSSYWTTGTNGDSIRYYINSTSYNAGSSNLGALSVLTNTSYDNIGDFTMTVDAAAASSASGSNYAIVFGYQTSGANAGDYYFIEFSATSGLTGLYKYTAGTGASTLIQAAQAPAVGGSGGGWIADTAYHAIKIQRTGTQISAWYDGEALFTSPVIDSSFVGGEIGLGAINDSAYFDNVIIG